jgi:hypothetical protein
MATVSTLRVEYVNTFLDLVLFNSAHQFMSPVLHAVYVTMTLFIFALEMSNEVSVAVTIAIVFYLLMWAVQFVVNVLYLYSRKNRSVLTRHVVEIRPEGLYEETKYNQSIFFWPGVVKAVRRLGYVAIYVTPHTAHIIPNRAFASPSNAEEFMRTIRERIRAA